MHALLLQSILASKVLKDKERAEKEGKLEEKLRVQRAVKRPAPVAPGLGPCLPLVPGRPFCT